MDGYSVFPYLFMSPLLLMLYQTIANQFLIIKKTLPSTIILALGAIVNIVLNYVLVNKIGIEGSAISTLIGYIISLYIACVVLKRMRLVRIRRKFITLCILTIIHIIVWRLLFPIMVLPALIWSFIILTLIFMLYKKTVLSALNKIKSIFKLKADSK